MSKTETPKFRNTGHSVVKKLIFSQPNFTLCLLNDEKMTIYTYKNMYHYSWPFLYSVNEDKIAKISQAIF